MLEGLALRCAVSLYADLVGVAHGAKVDEDGAAWRRQKTVLNAADLRVPALVLAAGGSRRLGRPKQLVEAEGERLLARAIRMAQSCGAEPVFVVLGSALEQIEAAVDLSGVRVVWNEGWQEGMASSIRSGGLAVQEQIGDAAGVLMLACDQPRVDASHLGQLLAAFRAHGGEVNVASAYAGTRGIPAIFSSQCFERLCYLRGDRGARPILESADLPVVEVPFPGGEIDIDTPADVEGLL